MAEPEFFDLTKDVFTPVAIGVLSGVISKKTEAPQEYLQTYKNTGGAAPANDAELGVPMFQDLQVSENIAHSELIDIYIMPLGEDGRVRVDV